MKKFLLSSLAAVAVLLVSAPASAMLGSGTAADPYLLSTSDDLYAMKSVLVAHQMTYFELCNDIAMDAPTASHKWEPLNGSDASTYDKWIGFDGKGHTISGFKSGEDAAGDDTDSQYYYHSFFGVLGGYCKNVKFTGVRVVDAGQGLGIICGYLGHSKYLADMGADAVCTIENVYVDGNAKEMKTGRYAGGIVGTIATKSVIKNVEMKANVYLCADNIKFGGVAGRVQAETTFENIVVAPNKFDLTNYSATPKTISASIGFVAGQVTGTVKATNLYLYPNYVLGFSAQNYGYNYTGLPSAGNTLSNIMNFAGTYMEDQPLNEKGYRPQIWEYQRSLGGTPGTDFNEYWASDMQTCAAAFPSVWTQSTVSPYMPALDFAKIAAGISVIAADEAVDTNAPVQMYTIGGVRVSADTTVPGIYVRKQGAKAVKVIIK